MKLPLKKIFYFILLTFLLEVILGFVRGYISIEASSYIGFFVYFILSIVIFLKIKQNRKNLFYCFLISFFLLEGLVMLIGLPSIPNILVFFDLFTHIMGIMIAHLILKESLSTTKKSILIVTIPLSTFIFFNYLSIYLENYKTFDSLTGSIKTINVVDTIGYDNNKTLITKRNLEGKITVLDFWYTKCGACFDRFPLLQEIENKYKSDTTIQFFTINTPLQGEAESYSNEVLISKGFSFRNILPYNNKVIPLFKIKAYPTTIIIDKENNIRFFGDIKLAEKELNRIISEYDTK